MKEFTAEEARAEAKARNDIARVKRKFTSIFMKQQQRVNIV